MKTRYAAILLALPQLCASVQASGILHYAGESIFTTNAKQNEVSISGISALTYDHQKNIFYAINDSRNNNKEGNVSLYTLKMQLSSDGIKKIDFLSQRPLLDLQHKDFLANSIDAEGLALTPDGKSLLWSSELGIPLRRSETNGVLQKTFSSLFPARFNITGDKESPTGVRSGTSWEGLSYSPDGKYLFMAVESSLKQDGPVASPVNSSTSRILQFSVDDRGNPIELVHEFLYITDPVPQVTPFGVNDNGVSEILALDNNQLLIVERSGRNVSEGFNDWDFSVRVYLTNTATASDIRHIDSLQSWNKKSTLQPVSKKQLIDFSDYTTTPDCIESVTFGPLINGHKSLVFVSDNNFQPHQKTKFYLFIDKEDALKKLSP